MPFKKGDPNINREGRPKGSVSVLTELRRMFAENPEDFRNFILRYKENPMNEKHIVEMLDGKPRQKIGLEGSEEGSPINIELSEIIAKKNDLN